MKPLMAHNLFVVKHLICELTIIGGNKEMKKEKKRWEDMTPEERAEEKEKDFTKAERRMNIATVIWILAVLAQVLGNLHLE